MSTYTITTVRNLPNTGHRSWSAWFGQYLAWTTDTPTGTGPTEAAAIADLLANYKAPWGDA